MIYHRLFPTGGNTMRITRVHTISFAVLFAAIVGLAAMWSHAARSEAASVPAFSEWGLITVVSAGWALDTMAIYHDRPVVNPSGCAVTNGGYATDPAHPGHSLFHAVA